MSTLSQTHKSLHYNKNVQYVIHHKPSHSVVYVQKQKQTNGVLRITCIVNKTSAAVLVLHSLLPLKDKKAIDYYHHPPLLLVPSR